MKKYIILLLFVLPIAGNTNAQDTTFPNEYLELVRTYKTLDEVYQAHPELKPEPPKIVITDEEVLFYGDGREVVNTMPVVREEPIPVDDPKFGEYDGKNILRFYGIIDDELLFLREVYGEWEGHTKPKISRLFDAQGNFITSINKLHTDVKVSPDNQYFMTYNYYSQDTVNIFGISGDIYSKSIINEPETYIDFSLNSMTIKIKNWHKGYVSVNSFLNEELFKLNYKGIINTDVLSAFVFDEFDEVLLSTYQESILFNYNNNQVWRIDVPYIIKCMDINDYLVLHSKEILNSNSFLDKLYIVYFGSGEIVFEASYDNVNAFTNEFIIIQNSKRYYEYKIY